MANNRGSQDCPGKITQIIGAVLDIKFPEGALPETVFFCDYASAGNTWDRDHYYRTWFPEEYGPTE